MSLTRLPAELRRRAACQHTCALAPLQQQRRQASILFALSALSNSRETQHFNKATKLSRVEHSPALKLIQTSEVDPFKAAKAAKRDVSGVSEGSVKVAEVTEGVGKGGQHAAALPSGDEAAAVSPPESTPSPSSSGSSGDGDGRRPPVGIEAAAEEVADVSDIEALKVGHAVLAEHVKEKRKLRQELDELKEYVGEQQQMAEWEKQRRSGSFLAYTFWSLAALCGITIYLYEQGKAQVPSVQERLENKRNASKAKQLEETEKELKEKTKEPHAHKALFEAEGKVLMDYYEKNKAYEAKMADWTKKAEELKRAVEKKDVRSLSKSEQNAYLEALVFLGVKDKPERRWWKGLFWSQE